MSGISIPGVGSGLDVNSMVRSLMAVERQPLQTLDTKKGIMESKISALGQIRSALDGLKTSLDKLSTSNQLNTLKTTLSDTSVATVSTSSSAVIANYSLEVEALATAQKLTSSSLGTETASLGSSPGSLTIEFGTYSGGLFTPNTNRASFTVNLETSQMTPAGVRDAINAAQKDVTASLVNNGSGVVMVLTNNQTGANQLMRVSVSDPDGSNTDNAGLSKLAYNPAATLGTGKNMTEQVAAQDATVKIDGVTVTSSTNTLSTAVTGLTINLLKTNDNAPISMTTARDDSQIKTAINGFITAYNSLQKLVKTLTSYDTVKKEAAILNGEITVRSAFTQVRGLFSQSYGTGSFTSVVDLGITTQSDGSLKFDTTKFDSAFSSNRDAVLSVFTQSSLGTEGEGFAGKVKTLVSSFLDTEGLLDARTKGLNSSIKNIDNQKIRMEERLAMIEQRYRTQFGALDVSMSKMQSLSTYLSQQLASLPQSS